MKRIIMILTIGLMTSACFAFPSLGSAPDENNDSGDLFENKDNDNNNNVNSPVGTATLLMLGMGGAYLGYKVKKNNKK